METIPNLSPAEIAALPLTCDVCSATPDDGLWMFPYSGFSMTTVNPGNPMQNLTTNAEPGQWGVCHRCAVAVLSRDARKLYLISRGAHGRCENPLAEKLMQIFFETLVPHLQDDLPTWITRR